MGIRQALCRARALYWRGARGGEPGELDLTMPSHQPLVER